MHTGAAILTGEGSDMLGKEGVGTLGGEGLRSSSAHTMYSLEVKAQACAVDVSAQHRARQEQTLGVTGGQPFLVHPDPAPQHPQAARMLQRPRPQRSLLPGSGPVP